ncbi:hypothetical protein CCP2SC5_2560001 [Azospirillaceae bacterium]
MDYKGREYEIKVKLFILRHLSLKCAFVDTRPNGCSTEWMGVLIKKAATFQPPPCNEKLCRRS